MFEDVVGISRSWKVLMCLKACLICLDIDDLGRDIGVMLLC